MGLSDPPLEIDANERDADWPKRTLDVHFDTFAELEEFANDRPGGVTKFLTLPGIQAHINDDPMLKQLAEKYRGT